MAAPIVIDEATLAELLRRIDAKASVRKSFMAYSAGNANMPAPGELIFSDPPGDAHIKYGHYEGSENYVVKVASGFPENMRRFGVQSSQGLMLLMSALTGEPRAVIFDGGRLTRERTAIAGALAAEKLKPSRIERIAVLGSGVQARLQVEHLKAITECRRLSVWSPNAGHAQAYARDITEHGFAVDIAQRPREAVSGAQLVVTTTRSHTPLLDSGDIAQGTHITCVGSDTPDKIELSPALLARADLLVADSIRQCRTRGEISQALRAGAIEERDVTELGGILAGTATGRTSDDQITIADLTGLAVQDLAIASAVFEAHR